MNSDNRKLAPVAIFVYDRPNNTKRVIDSLSKNFLAPETEIFIFSDAPRSKRNAKEVDKVREYLKKIKGFKSVTIIEREENFYIERNIIEGVTEIINTYGKIIVLEDDVLVTKDFLNYMNNALDFYQEKENIMHIGSLTFIKMPESYKKTILWRYPENGGGWGTWKNRWEKFVWFKTEQEALDRLSIEQRKIIELDGSFSCLNNLKLIPIPWDICWYIAIVCNNGLAVNPLKSLTKNIGLYSGTHFSIINRLLGKHPFDTEIFENQKIIFDEILVENIEAISLLKKFYSNLEQRKIIKLLNIFR